MTVRPPSAEGPQGPRIDRPAARKPSGPEGAHAPTRAHGAGRVDRIELSPEALALNVPVAGEHRPPDQAMAPERLAAILARMDQGGYDRWEVRREVIERVLAKLSGPEPVADAPVAANPESPASDPTGGPAPDGGIAGANPDGVERA